MQTSATIENMKSTDQSENSRQIWWRLFIWFQYYINVEKKMMTERFERLVLFRDNFVSKIILIITTTIR